MSSYRYGILQDKNALEQLLKLTTKERWAYCWFMTVLKKLLLIIFTIGLNKLKPTLSPESKKYSSQINLTCQNPKRK